ncbi:MAG: Crp/Fnr family transcriptional regulator [Gammaproteobacteria bacterium]|nr:Crp/Fnr family transcriptional regulator [Gammaproteobacteria bacterium]
MTAGALPECLPPALVERSDTVPVAGGERLFSFGAPVTHVYFVLEGEMKAVRYLPDGREVIMLRAGAGEFFGESALAVETFVCDAFATRPSRVVALPAATFRAQLQQDPAFAHAFSMLMAKAARRQCSRYERLRLSKARDRVLHLLGCEADGNGRYTLAGTLADLAGELGLEPETLYRMLAELKREGHIARDRKALHLLRHD